MLGNVLLPAAADISVAAGFWWLVLDRNDAPIGLLVRYSPDLFVALLVITGFSGMNPWILLPATIIMFREVFVSGLREFLGETAGTLKVTNLAKWKTTVQMTAIAVLFAKGAFEHFIIEQTIGMDQALVEGILDGTIEDMVGLRWKDWGWHLSWYGGIILLWVAAALTFLTAWDYFKKARPYLQGAK